MPATRIPGRMYESGHANDGVHAVMACLQAWFEALQDGTAAYRMPDTDYQRSYGRPQWTEDELDRLMRDMDAEIDQEVGRAPGTSTGSKLGSGFQRLAVPQRLALAQQLDAIIVKHMNDLGYLHQAGITYTLAGQVVRVDRLNAGGFRITHAGYPQVVARIGEGPTYQEAWEAYLNWKPAPDPNQKPEYTG